MPRAVSEWIGRTDDSKPPPKVRLRIFDREGGICHECKRKIEAGERWEADHRPALINGGENRESKIFPVHDKCHKKRTAQDVAEKSKVAKIRQKHAGIRKATQKIQSRGFAKTEKPNKITKGSLPPRSLYTERND